jgi:signal transduction histidine kinase
LSLRGDWLEVQVRDAGHTTRSTLAATGSGLGLSRMRARIESLGGRLDAGPDSAAAGVETRSCRSPLVISAW